MIKEFKFLENYYIISENGEITKQAYNNKVFNQGKWRLVHHSSQIIKPYIDADGYANVRLISNHKDRMFRVHHLVYMIFILGMTYLDNNSTIGYNFSTKNFIQINHIDGNKLNNNFRNLEIVSLQENIKHAIKNNLHNSQWIRKTVRIYEESKFIAEVDTVRGASNFLKSIGISIDQGSICRLIKSGKSRKGISFKYKSND